jgi:hypothetical protein
MKIGRKSLGDLRNIKHKVYNHPENPINLLGLEIYDINFFSTLDPNCFGIIYDAKKDETSIFIVWDCAKDMERISFLSD